MSAAPVYRSAATLSMADGCLTSLPAALFTSAKAASLPFISLPPKPLRLFHLSSPLSSSPTLVSLRKRAPFVALVALVAQTSDWAQQEENNVKVEEKEEEGGFEWAGKEGLQQQQEESDGTGVEAKFSEWEEAAEGEGDFAAKGEAFEEGGEGEGFSEPPEEAKLFVGNLTYDIDSEKLAQLFEQAGIVEVAEVIYNRETDQSRGFGFVTMSTVEEAEKAIEMFHRYDAGGRLLTVNKAAPRGLRPERSPREFEPSFRMYVGNLPWQVDDVRLEQVFSEHGKVVDARVVYDRETGRSRGFGFVTMSTHTEMDDAIAALDGQSLDGRAIRVNVAEERPKRSPF